MKKLKPKIDNWKTLHFSNQLMNPEIFTTRQFPRIFIYTVYFALKILVIRNIYRLYAA